MYYSRGFHGRGFDHGNIRGFGNRKRGSECSVVGRSGWWRCAETLHRVLRRPNPEQEHPRGLYPRRLDRQRAWAMVKRRAQQAGIATPGICNHTFRGTGITAYLENPRPSWSTRSRWPRTLIPKRHGSMIGAMMKSLWMRSKGSGSRRCANAPLFSRLRRYLSSARNSRWGFSSVPANAGATSRDPCLPCQSSALPVFPGILSHKISIYNRRNIPPFLFFKDKPS